MKATIALTIKFQVDLPDSTADLPFIIEEHTCASDLLIEAISFLKPAEQCICHLTERKLLMTHK